MIFDVLHNVRLGLFKCFPTAAIVVLVYMIYVIPVSHILTQEVQDKMEQMEVLSFLSGIKVVYSGLIPCTMTSSLRVTVNSNLLFADLLYSTAYLHLRIINIIHNRWKCHEHRSH